MKKAVIIKNCVIYILAAFTYLFWAFSPVGFTVCGIVWIAWFVFSIIYSWRTILDDIILVALCTLVQFFMSLNFFENVVFAICIVTIGQPIKVLINKTFGFNKK